MSQNVKRQQIIWQTIRELRTFTGADVICATSLNDSTVKNYLQKLKKGGFITVVSRHKKGQVVEYVYELSNDIGSAAPRLTHAGKPSVHSRRKENLWRSIRMLREFDDRELTMAANTEELPISPLYTLSYIGWLKKAGYLRVVKPHSKSGGRARYRLHPHMNTGPNPPRIRSVKQLFDPNLDQVVYPKTELELEEKEC